MPSNQRPWAMSRARLMTTRATFWPPMVVPGAMCHNAAHIVPPRPGPRRRTGDGRRLLDEAPARRHSGRRHRRLRTPDRNAYQSAEAFDENVAVTEARILGSNFEAKVDGSAVRLQVVAG